MLLKFYPEYFKRDKEQITLFRVTRLIKTLKLDQVFTNVSNRLLDLLWNDLKTGSESTVAAAICLLTKILLERSHPSLKEICKYLRIRTSMPYIHLKKLKINNIDFKSFHGLQTSSFQIRKIFHKDKILNQYIKLGI